jgi:tetratricopeptide (TPR) repeat protein
MEAGLRLLRAGAAEKALGPLNKVVERSPENADALYAAALCLYELGKDDDVRPLLDRALKADPKHPGGHLLAGFLEQQAARIKAARVHYTRFLEAAPGAEQAADVKNLLEQLPESAP